MTFYFKLTSQGFKCPAFNLALLTLRSILQTRRVWESRDGLQVQVAFDKDCSTAASLRESATGVRVVVLSWRCAALGEG